MSDDIMTQPRDRYITSKEYRVEVIEKHDHGHWLDKNGQYTDHNTKYTVDAPETWDDGNCTRCDFTHGHVFHEGGSCSICVQWPIHVLVTRLKKHVASLQQEVAALRAAGTVQDIPRAPSPIPDGEPVITLKQPERDYPDDERILHSSYIGHTNCSLCMAGVTTWGDIRKHLKERHDKTFNDVEPYEYVIGVWLPR